MGDYSAQCCDFFPWVLKFNIKSINCVGEQISFKIILVILEYVRYKFLRHIYQTLSCIILYCKQIFVFVTIIDLLHIFLIDIHIKGQAYFIKLLTFALFIFREIGKCSSVLQFLQHITLKW